MLGKKKIEKKDQVINAYHTWTTEEISKMKQVSLGSGNDVRCDNGRHSHITETQDTKT